MDFKRNTIQKEAVLLFVIASLFAGLVFVGFNDPLKSSFYPPCFFKKVTSLNCPGCGTGRALYQLLHGNLLAAIDYNMLIILFLPVIFIGVIHFFSGRLNTVWKVLNRPLFFLIIIITFWVLRNIPLYPFNILNADH